ncbi:hypothetical protein GPJ56_009509 [Histomonas meleagridis]|uniref:uncharacterized protein n=1 Tax=Histomonas meleagridis TaxID=135588 RepID=UPI00355ACA13|nr:hypothetical protein GPJ56_009509 [Histomonas meleagridis]KAH0804650.1 hypothetical protein GO595_002586 [Histomonas meleagridis]
MLQSFLTPELQEMVSDTSTDIHDVLSLGYISKSARIGFSSVIDYLVAHSHDILNYAFKDEKSVVSTNAYAILSLGNPQILKPILDDSSFQNTALEILSKESVPQFTIGRLSSLTLTLLTNLPEQATESCGFIYHLLKYCENPGVFNFFETICSADPKYELTQKWLNEMGFSEYLLRELDKIDFSYESQEANKYKDSIYIRCLCFYKLIGKCCDNPIMVESFQSEHVVDSLSQAFPNEPSFIRSARWDSISAITSQKTAVFLLKKLFQTAVDILMEQFDRLLAYRVSALTFITKMLTIAPLSFELLLQSSMPQLLIHIVVQFPYSTFLHSAFLKFVEVGLTHLQFAIKIVGCYTPVIIDIAEDRKNRILSPCCIKMLEMFLEKAKTNKEISQVLNETPGIAKFVRGTMKEYQKLVDTPYGEPQTGVLKMIRNIFN